MNAISKGKWIGSLILASILLILAMIGGTWGTTYAAEVNQELTPVITSITPFEIEVGRTTDVIMRVHGYNFEDENLSLEHTSVRLSDGGTDMILEVYNNQKFSTDIYVRISASLFTVPNIFYITVVKSTVGTTPTVPILPAYDLVSNAVPFNVYQVQPKYIPVVFKIY